jgi:hypothetical protein
MGDGALEWGDGQGCWENAVGLLIANFCLSVDVEAAYPNSPSEWRHHPGPDSTGPPATIETLTRPASQ